MMRTMMIGCRFSLTLSLMEEQMERYNIQEWWIKRIAILRYGNIVTFLRYLKSHPFE
jgi:hypothetical protein